MNQHQVNQFITEADGSCSSKDPRCMHQPAAQTEQEAFEAEMRCEETWGHRSLKKRPDGGYQNWQVNVMWGVWQARASLPTQPAAQATPDHAAEIARLKAVIDQLERREILAVAQQATPEPVGEVVYIAKGHLREVLNGNTMNAYLSPEPDRFADVALSTSPAPGVPDGFALVPVEPTQAMLDALHSSAYLPGCYRALLAAAQAKGGE